VALAGQALISLVMALVTLAGVWPDWAYFPAFLFWTTSIFFMAGLTVGNLNAIAMEPLGHIAGMAASMTSAVSTVVAVMIAAPIGLAFDGTPVPLAFSIAAMTLVGFGLMKLMTRRQPAEA
jgi:MFS transporter, DHA1 family, multidrug resistance protein